MNNLKILIYLTAMLGVFSVITGCSKKADNPTHPGTCYCDRRRRQRVSYNKNRHTDVDGRIDGLSESSAVYGVHQLVLKFYPFIVF